MALFWLVIILTLLHLQKQLKQNSHYCEFHQGPQALYLKEKDIAEKIENAFVFVIFASNKQPPCKTEADEKVISV